ncbi:MAG TPA: hypothetical protein VK308_09520, partial [Pyrinomonadaceae bacterium]|nr:hypothetical protein [Pyrinomonadaceae bacterium]
RLELPTGGTSPIVPIFTKSSYAARQAAQKLLENGIYTPPITYPAVAHDQSRLRFTITAAHRKSELDRALNALDAARPIFAAVEPKKNTLNGFENIFSNGGAQLSTKFGYLEALHSGASSSEESLLTLARTIVSSNGNG